MTPDPVDRAILFYRPEERHKALLLIGVFMCFGAFFGVVLTLMLVAVL